MSSDQALSEENMQKSDVLTAIISSIEEADPDINGRQASVDAFVASIVYWLRGRGVCSGRIGGGKYPFRERLADARRRAF